VFEIAGKLDIPEPVPDTMEEVNDILFKYEGPCDTPEEMLDRANEYLKRTRALAHEYVRLPEDEECICLPVPECCKDSYPWGGYEGGDFSIRPLVGQMFLNVYNYKNVTDGWIRMNTLHEAYPGHHVQYVRAVVDETPETVKIGAKLVPLLEGTCLRTERAFPGYLLGRSVLPALCRIPAASCFRADLCGSDAVLLRGVSGGSNQTVRNGTRIRQGNGKRPG